MLTDVFENSRHISLEIRRLDPAHFLTAPGLTLLAALKKTKVKLYLLNDIDMFLMIEKGIGGEIFHSVHQYEKANNKYIKDYCENKESSYLMHWDVYNLYDWF